MADEKKPGLWDDIKNALKKSTTGKPENDDDPDDTSPDDLTNDDDDGDYEDASEVVKALTEKIATLEESLEVMAKAQTTMLEKMTEAETLQKSLGQGMLAIMERTEEVLASPQPRKGAVSGIEALKKSMGGAAPEDGGTPAGSLKPFTAERMDFTKDILTKAVKDREISLMTCGKWETHMNKSVGKVAYPFPLDFVAFMQNKLGKQGA